LQLQHLDDLEIYYKAKKGGRIIILSKDSDLPAIVDRLGSPPKIINIKVGNAGNHVLYDLIKNNIERCIRILTQFDLNTIDLYPKP
jgi:predicted nuclease of predicted toxin-antitoxin system